MVSPSERAEICEDQRAASHADRTSLVVCTEVRRGWISPGFKLILSQIWVLVGGGNVQDESSVQLDSSWVEFPQNLGQNSAMKRQAGN